MSIEAAIAANTAALEKLTATILASQGVRLPGATEAKPETAKPKAAAPKEKPAAPAEKPAAAAPVPPTQPTVAELRGQCSSLVLKAVAAVGKEKTLAALQGVAPGAKNVSSVPDAQVPALLGALTALVPTT